MLSPNATYRVTVERGGPSTVTTKLHDPVCCIASTALQTTTVDPIGKFTPLAGVHVVVSGAVPPLAAGAVNITWTGSPFADGTVRAVGHISVIGRIVGDGPVMLLLEHAAAPAALNITTAKRRLCATGRNKLTEPPMVACRRMTAKRLS